MRGAGSGILSGGGSRDRKERRTKAPAALLWRRARASRGAANAARKSCIPSRLPTAANFQTNPIGRALPCPEPIAYSRRSSQFPSTTVAPLIARCGASLERDARASVFAALGALIAGCNRMMSFQSASSDATRSTGDLAPANVRPLRVALRRERSGDFRDRAAAPAATDAAGATHPHRNPHDAAPAGPQAPERFAGLSDDTVCLRIDAFDGLRAAAAALAVCALSALTYSTFAPGALGGLALTACAALALAAVCRTLTRRIKIGITGITTQAWFSRTRRLRWPQVRTMSFPGGGMVLHGPGHRRIVVPADFGDYRRAAALIRLRLPPPVLERVCLALDAHAQTLKLC
ncbi:PH domain-containing protein [Lysobacter sp. K5869]|uniref:PH domain-containing protein n=1 Tax=Lysobacter sp. K5869 TaxID=2820808 RepID=UPI001C061F79|nr:PH domain-containing protein [Lysobacter sp. K5869]QWP75219.1 PH domain-containing protein [Lysobacter sp. K5869]